MLQCASTFYIQFIQLIYNKALKKNRPSNCLVNGQTSKTDKQRISDMETEVNNNIPQVIKIISICNAYKKKMLCWKSDNIVCKE